MSRADELKTFTVIGASKSGERPGEFFPCLDRVSQACDAGSAAAIIRDLEDTIAERNARIAELEEQLINLQSALDQAGYCLGSINTALVNAGCSLALSLERGVLQLAQERDVARASVPEWCVVILTVCVRWYRHRMQDRRSTHEDVADLETVIHAALDQLRACGIDVP